MKKKIAAFPLSEQHLQTLNFQESIPDFEKNSKYYETCFLLVCCKKLDSAKKKLHRQNGYLHRLGIILYTI